MKMVEQIGRFFGIVWRTGNFWGRIFILLIVGWPLLLAFTSAVGGGVTFTSLLALIPFLAIVAGIAAYPVISAALVYFDKSRAILGWIAAIIGVELVIGAYFSALPLSNDRGLAPLLVLVIAALILLSLAKKLASVRTILWIALVILTLIFAFGGRDEVKKMGARTGGQGCETCPKTQRYEIIDNLAVPYDHNEVRPRVEMQTTRLEENGGKLVTLVTNCRGDDLIGTLKPGDSIKIRHVFKSLDRENHCSFSATGRALPIYGLRRNGVTGVNLRAFENDLPFPQLPAHADIFYLKSRDGLKREPHYIEREGGAIRLTNFTDRDMEVRHAYNYPAEFMNEQIGWDGSTASFEAVKY